MTSPHLTLPTWEEVLAQQHGVLSRAQALGAGMSRRAWAWRHDSGRWSALLPGVALSHLGTPDDEQIGWGAVVHCGSGSAVTGDWALLLQGFRSTARPTRVDVAVTEGRAVRRAVLRAGDDRLDVVPRQVRRPSGLVHPVRRPPVVRLPTAVLHAVAVAPTDRAAEWRVAAVVQQRLTTPAHLRTALEHQPRLRRRRLVAAVLADVEQGAHSGSELDFLRLLREAGLPPPDRLQRPVRANGKRYLDAWWERQRVAAEIDGAHHVEVGQWDDDVLRHNAVVLAERTDRVLPLRFTTTNLRHDRAEVISQLQIALL
ncbi:MAG TPA: hypothetical protein VNU26_07175 [Mycobacteriales bacterium]|nr:hypothetical protein [Mycobacteriales bacterium]